jgi:DNA-binding NtrC family response regulator
MIWACGKCYSGSLSLLVQHYLRRFSRELGREVRQVAPEAMEQLHHYSWPGNIRELQGFLKQALLQASGPVLLPAFLSETLGGPAKSHRGFSRVLSISLVGSASFGSVRCLHEDIFQWNSE